MIRLTKILRVTVFLFPDGSTATYVLNIEHRISPFKGLVLSGSKFSYHDLANPAINEVFFNADNEEFTALIYEFVSDPELDPQKANAFKEHMLQQGWTMAPQV